MADKTDPEGGTSEESNSEPVKVKNEIEKKAKKKKPQKKSGTVIDPPLDLGDQYQFEGEEKGTVEETNAQSEAEANLVLEESSQTKSDSFDAQNNSDEAWKEEVEKRLKATFDRALQKPIYSCTDCDQVFQNKPKARLHVEVHIQGFSHTCQYCGAQKKTRSMLKSHVYLQHTKPKST